MSKTTAHVMMSLDRMMTMYDEGERMVSKRLEDMITANPAKSNLMNWTPDELRLLSTDVINLALFHVAAQNASLEREPGDESLQPPF